MLEEVLKLCQCFFIKLYSYILHVLVKLVPLLSTNESEDISSSSSSSSSSNSSMLPLVEVVPSYIKGMTYLDYAGSCLPSIYQLLVYHKLCMLGSICNPHSKGLLAEHSAYIIDQAREVNYY